MDNKKEYRQLCEFRNIIIYGAGAIGTGIARQIEKEGYKDKILGFAVTKQEGNKPSVRGFDVKAIELWDGYKTSATVIISVGNVFQEEIKKNLINCGFKDFVCFQNVEELEMFAEAEIIGKVELAVADVILEQFHERDESGGLQDYNRLDIFVRLLAAENYYGLNDFGFDFYSRMQGERIEKEYIGEAVKKYRELLAAWDCDGYRKDSAILLDSNMQLIDGSHRLALAIYHGETVITCEIVKGVRNITFGKRWFTEHCFSQEELASILQKADMVYRNFSEKSRLLYRGMGSNEFSARIKEDFFNVPQVFGRGQFYQSLPALGISGQRPTEERIHIYGMDNILQKEHNVLDIGCNCGFLDLTIANCVSHITGVEYNTSLVRIAQKTADHLGISNTMFCAADFVQWKARTSEKFDVIFSFAVHYWIGLSSEKYAEALTKLLNPGGYIFFESQNVKMDNDNFEEYCAEFKRCSFKSIQSGLIKDDGDIERKFVILRKD